VEIGPKIHANMFGKNLRTRSSQPRIGVRCFALFTIWPTGATDANNQTTTTTYDALGRSLTIVKPGETNGTATATVSYTSFCPTTGTTKSSLPCLEVDTTQQISSGTTATSRVFYDGAGHAVESRTPGPSGQDVIQFALYDDTGRLAFVSQAYFVTTYTGAPGTAAWSAPVMSTLGTSATYDNDTTNRTAKVVDAQSHTTSTNYSVACNVSDAPDTNCYALTTVIDANSHQTVIATDGLGRTAFSQRFTGTSAYTLYSTTTTSGLTYTASGQPIQTSTTNGATTTTTYNDLGQTTSQTDPSTGTTSYSYDANGALLSAISALGRQGTVYMGYDGLGRQLWASTSSTGSSPLATWTYDSTANGNNRIGHLTSETFASGPNQSVTGGYAYTYDARGRQTTWTMTLGSTSYPFTTAYNDADQPTSLTYPNGDTLTTGFAAPGWVGNVNLTSGSTTTPLLNSVSYQGTNGAAQQPTSASVANGAYQWTWNYDGLIRNTETKVQASGTTFFDQTRTFDNIGNVLTTNTTLAAGTDNQAFCYDNFNRLTWAGSTGTPSCGSSLTAGTLTSAAYQQSYAYDQLDRMTTGPDGSGYAYGDSNHLTALTSAPNYTASYDAAGKMITRNGGVLTYDALQHLLTWQNAATNPTSTTNYAYDGEGKRVQQTSTVNGTATTTSYIGSYEEVVTTGSTTTTIVYYNAGPVQVENQGGTLSYLAGDSQGSVSLALNTSGSVVATALYSPFGTTRYHSGTMPTDKGYLGAIGDASGLLYTGSSYYDASVGVHIDGTNAAPSGTSVSQTAGAGAFSTVSPLVSGATAAPLPANAYANGTGPSGLGAPPSLGPVSNGHGGTSGSGRSTLNGGQGGTGNSNMNIGQIAASAIGSAFSRFPIPTLPVGGPSSPQIGSPPFGFYGDISKCASYSHCFILDEGVDIAWGKPMTGGDEYDQELAWESWVDAIKQKYNTTVGFVYGLAPDGIQRADQIHYALSALGKLGYTGLVDVVGHSNGAASLFTYLADRELGQFQEDRQINRFTALDLPTSDVFPLNALTWGWSETTSIQVGLAARYVSQTTIHGTYAYNWWDPVSGMAMGP
jgi:YD repeat-containing protein